MATCKKCGAKTSFLSSLCESCKKGDEEGENPITDEQFNEIKGDNKYFTQLLDAIVKHTSRNLIYEHFAYLTTATRNALETRFKRKAASLKNILAVLVIIPIVMCLSIVGVIFAGKNVGAHPDNDNYMAFLIWSFIVFVASVVFGINRLINLRRAIGCRRILKRSI